MELSLHGKPYFLFPDVLKRWSFQKNRAGTWSFLYYWEIWYFSFAKIWSYPLNEKWKMIFLTKNTRKYIFFKRSEKMVFSKRAAQGHDLSCITWKDGIFYPKTWYFFLGQEVRDDISQEEHGNMMFSVYTYGCYERGATPPCQKKSKMVLSRKNTPKDDWRSRFIS